MLSGTRLLCFAAQHLAPDNFLSRVFPTQSTALTVLIVGLVASSGLALGSFRIRGFSLGIPGVMFTGLIFGRLIGEGTLNPVVVGFLRDFGLILFVYAVGVQVGPGFFASLRSHGLRWNLLALSAVLMGAGISVGIAFLFPEIGIHGAVGLFAGATTNAPSFAAASEVIRGADPIHGRETVLNLTSPAFAISYPFGLLGVILAMLIVRWVFRVSLTREAELAHLAQDSEPPPSTLNLELQNPNLQGVTVERLEQLQGGGIVISRVLHRGAVSIPRPESELHTGDVVLAVGTPTELEEFRLIAGQKSATDLRRVAENIIQKDIVVTHREVLGKTVNSLALPKRFGVNITRVRRGAQEFTAVHDFELQFGDLVVAVGEPGSMDAAANLLGNSTRELNLPRILPMFVGVTLGVVLGSLPVTIPGLPMPVKLGLAAGPLIVAILLARLGRVGGLLWYMPLSASGLLRELGITLFLICVGILAGDSFFATLVSPLGLNLLWLGSVVTLVPLLTVGIACRAVYGMNFLHTCGVIAGSQTSPSLAFTQTLSPSEAPALAFATVYPLAMILRVLMGQLLVLVFSGG